MLAATLAVPGFAAAQPVDDREWALMLFPYRAGGSTPAHLMNRDACAAAATTHKDLLSFGGRNSVVVTCTNIRTGEVIEH